MVEKYFPHEMWNLVLFGNTTSAFADAMIFFMVITVIFTIVTFIARRELRIIATRTTNKADDLALALVKIIQPQLYVFIALYISLQTIVLNHIVDKVFFMTIVLVFTFHLTKAVDLIVQYLLHRILSNNNQDSQEAEDKNLESIVSLMTGLFKGALWVLAIIAILSNVGFDVTSLIAGLGIGGIAIAFAVKGILEDLFSSFSLYLDKPFAVGDVIAVGDETGIVQKIGVKTTRLKSLSSGEELVMTNKELTSSKIKNFRRMTKRRVRFDIGVTYDTTPDKITRAQEIIRQNIEKESDVEYGWTHFNEFGDSALIIKALYYYCTRDYVPHLESHERILMGIHQDFTKENIEMAFPSQTIYMANTMTDTASKK